MPTDNAVIWWCNASTATTRRGGAPLRRYKSEETVSKTREKGIANTLTDISVRYARWECVTQFPQHNQIIHDRFYRNFQATVAVKKTICHWIIVHSFLLNAYIHTKVIKILHKTLLVKHFLAFTRLFFLKRAEMILLKWKMTHKNVEMTFKSIGWHQEWHQKKEWTLCYWSKLLKW